MKLTLPAAAVAALTFGASAVLADTVALYPFTGNSLASTDGSADSNATDINFTGSSITAAASGTTGTAGQRSFSTANGTPAPSLRLNAAIADGGESAAFANNRFLQFTVTPTGLPLEYETVTLDLAAFSTTAVGGYTGGISVRTSVDGFSTATDSVLSTFISSGGGGYAFCGTDS